MVFQRHRKEAASAFGKQPRHRRVLVNGVSVAMDGILLFSYSVCDTDVLRVVLGKSIHILVSVALDVRGAIQLGRANHAFLGESERLVGRVADKEWSHGTEHDITVTGSTTVSARGSPIEFHAPLFLSAGALRAIRRTPLSIKPRCTAQESFTRLSKLCVCWSAKVLR